MSKEISIAEARDHLPALVHEVERGAPIRLTRRGKPVAVLVSIEQYEQFAEGRPDLWKALEAFRKKHDLGGANLDGVFEDVRDNSPGRDVKW